MYICTLSEFSLIESSSTSYSQLPRLWEVETKIAISIYLCVCVCIYIYIYIYVYLHLVGILPHWVLINFVLAAAAVVRGWDENSDIYLSMCVCIYIYLSIYIYVYLHLVGILPYWVLINFVLAAAAVVRGRDENSYIYLSMCVYIYIYIYVYLHLVGIFPHWVLINFVLAAAAVVRGRNDSLALGFTHDWHAVQRLARRLVNCSTKIKVCGFEIGYR